MALQQTEVCPDSDLNVSFTCLEMFLCACEKGVCVCVCAPNSSLVQERLARKLGVLI